MENEYRIFSEKGDIHEVAYYSILKDEKFYLVESASNDSGCYLRGVGYMKNKYPFLKVFLKPPLKNRFKL